MLDAYIIEEIKRREEERRREQERPRLHIEEPLPTADDRDDRDDADDDDQDDSIVKISL